MSKIEHNESDSILSSLRGKVFNQLQNDIINGKYQPGENLIETRLSEELGVSRTPIREALRQLELEGLVQSIPNKGVVVTGVSTKDIKDIYTIRTMIEGLAAKWAAEKITPEELVELKESLELEEFYTLRNDTSHVLKLDSKYHELIFKASKSRPLLFMLSTFHLYIQRARNISISSPGRAEQALLEHKAIFKAISEGDAEMAQILTTEHVKNASINLIKQINDKEDI
ncbi:MAG: GntR family transcriptional regulator [Bacillota bacterium]|nr:GntR family transcriptional regulator [Bacillota bacterium]